MIDFWDPKTPTTSNIPPHHMTPEPQEPPFLVQAFDSLYHAVKAFPGMVAGSIIGFIVAVLTDREIFFFVSGIVLLSFVLPIFYTVGGGLLLYALLRTINAWIALAAQTQGQHLNTIAQVMASEQRVAIVQVPEVLTRELPPIIPVDDAEDVGE